ncbi:MAG: 2Fe-2S iron-sulfur cluster binding domain-containing protein [Methyloprofundus sp.]|nr:2Fe-2S iron-sulfur cluster binding domain-containing protein [Methyloprofundus sp.]MDT8425584.1 2Fe-2S iron-sulfur cluster binding domain-containing protein [Methyloprofundus sp.]
MSYKITLTTHDQQQFSFACTEQQNVQDAAEAAHIYPPFGCKSGSCGACLGTCNTGEYQLESHTEAALSTEAAARGDILLCRTLPKTDLHITLPYDASAIQQTLMAPRVAEIIRIESIAERTLQVTLQLQDDPETGLAFEFEPGQFVELEVPELNLMRAYSIANTPNWEGRLEFLIRLQPNGKFCAFLQQAAIGQQLLVHAPSGAFVAHKQSLNPRCFVAGGTGLAPFLSILRRMAEWAEDHPTHLFLGVNKETEIVCQDELNTLQQSLPQLSVEICVWKPETNWRGFIGTPADALKIHLKNNASADIYLCGPPILVETAEDIALKANIPADQIFCERFL